MMRKSEPIVFFAPGFLGHPEDGAIFKTASTDFFGLDFFSPQGILSSEVFFNAEKDFFPLLAEKILQQIDHLDSSRPLNLIGYSFGGRILSHVFLKQPQRFHRLYLLSSHFGLSSLEEKAARKNSDHVWAEKFQSMRWEDVMREWNQQSVFTDGGSPQREEKNYHRHSLSLAFRAFGLGEQQNLEQDLLLSRDRVVYVCGEKDAKFVNLAQRYQRLGFQTHVIAGSGHRVLFDQPEAVLKVIQRTAQ